MTTRRILTGAVLTILFNPLISIAQVVINNPGSVVERKVENRANSKIDQGIDKGLDAAEQGIINLFKKKNKDTKPDKSAKPGKEDTSAEPASAESDEAAKKISLTAYGKFDFIPGEKIVANDDFSQDVIGDFPAKWNTNSSGELVAIEGQRGKWLKLGPSGVLYPEFITQVPENFTLEFDLASTSEFSYYSGAFRTIFAQVVNPKTEFSNWGWYDGDKTNGLEFELHPKDETDKRGQSGFKAFGAEKGKAVMENTKNLTAFNVPDRNVVKVSVWRQKTRLRVYVNEEKIWDLPRAFVPETRYNFIAFSNKDYRDSDSYFIANLKLAVGAPDTRNKLITEGKFSTSGILFDVNSANIKPQSYGILKDIAGVLTENPDIKVEIIGHTDSDGDDASNLALSKKRSEAVAAALSREFAIDNNRLTTNGKGETEPISPNTSPEAKANNRRVEFIKM